MTRNELLSRGIRPCENATCHQGATMGTHCIRHWYETRGKTCPGYEPGGWFTQRPVDGNYVTAGRTGTSLQAADRALPKSGTQRRRIYDAIRASRTGLTRDELEEQLHIPCNSINPRLKELELDRWIEDSGRTRLTRSGSPAIVWKARS